MFLKNVMQTKHLNGKGVEFLNLGKREIRIGNVIHQIDHHI